MNRKHETIIVRHVGQSSLGTAGLILSAIGWLTCGLLCIPGAFFSFLGLFSNKQKGHAVAGLIVGFPGVLFFATIGMGVIVGILGFGAASSAIVAESIAQQQRTQTQSQLPEIESDPVVEQTLLAQLPDDMEPPSPEVSTFRKYLDVTGKHEINAEFLERKKGWVKLRREDGKLIAVEIIKLSNADQKWLDAHHPEN